MRELRKEDSTIEFRFWGGDLMEAEGGSLVKHYRDLAFMGFAEVVMNLRTILKNISFCKQDIDNFAPDAVLLVDYPGFNMRIANYCKQQGIPVFYYISPQIWAWKEKRVHQIKRTVTQMFVILPFEKAFYAKHGMEVSFVGHPLLDVIGNHGRAEKSIRAMLGLSEGQKMVALLPGSRKQEIKTMLPVMLKAVTQHPDTVAVIAGAPGQDPSFYHSIAGVEKHHLVFGRTYDLFEEADAGLVTSGTATLEAGLFGMPLAVCYRGGKISYHIAKRLIRVKYISLINLVLDRQAVPELIQDEMNAGRLSALLPRLLEDADYRREQLESFVELRKVLGGSGAAERTAKELLKTLRSLQEDRRPLK